MMRSGVRKDLIYQTDRLNGPQCFIIDSDSAWVVDQLIQLLNNKHLHTDLPQVIRYG